jgi:hypothetical protein
VLAALPAEVRTRVEESLAKYGKEDGPAEAFPLFPEQPLPGETVVAPPLPKQPPRRKPGLDYCSGSQPSDWVARSIQQSGRPLTKVGKPRATNRPKWNASPSGKWISPLADR